MAGYIIICMVTVLAGLAQGVCGFGAGILTMMALPHYFPMSRAAGISGAISLALTLLMVLKYRRHVNVKKTLLPLLVYAACSALAIRFGARLDQALLKRVFGGFLICLTLYHFLLSKKEVSEWSAPVCVAAWAFSGVCSGLFAVGGPLMVLYFISHTKSNEEFLGTTELLFFVNLVSSTYLRIEGGIITASDAPLIALCIVCVGLGLFIANKIVARINGARLKNIVYIGVGISGVINLLGG